ncbi:glycosyltransferase [Lacinutrix gracilariae]|uniref:Glycosyltransferase n=1 Tax=Lacinutrix gracilariae TaxID=1747198 RepID=A0ABW5JZU3_9FLAO
MKIGIVLSKPPTYSETFFNSKIKGLQSNGFDVVLLVQKKDSNFKLCKTKVAPAVYKKNLLLQFFTTLLVGLKFIFFSRRILKFIQLEKQENKNWSQVFKNLYTNAHILTTKLDWVHFGFVTMAIQSEHVAKAINAKMAISMRGFDVDVFPLKHKEEYVSIWKHVDKVHSISNYLLEKAYVLGLSKNIAYQIITPALDTSKFINPSALQLKPIEFVTISRLHWMKGLHYTLEALAILKSKGVNFKYTIIGSGKAFESLSFAIHELDLKQEVVLVGDKPQKDIINYLSKANMYLQYSNSEGFCNATLEAQAMGLLCIVSNGGGLIENVLDKQTGWVVPKRNPEALANKIIEVIHLPEVEKNKISKQAIARVHEKFNLQLQEKQFVAFYE